ncbi:MAG TPA: BlaI/MecI/CopY family transcriptional regulator [Solirubrobacterales bacterium]|jgi:predicted transcriptional regulator
MKSTAKSEKTRDNFGPLERIVMEVVWEAGEPVAVREVVDRLNESRTEPLAYTTVMTVMARLAEKGVLERQKRGRGYIYEASAPDAAGLAVKEVLQTYGDSAVAHFVDEARADPEVLERLRGLLRDGDG